MQTVLIIEQNTILVFVFLSANCKKLNTHKRSEIVEKKK